MSDDNPGVIGNILGLAFIGAIIGLLVGLIGGHDVLQCVGYGALIGAAIIPGIFLLLLGLALGAVAMVVMAVISIPYMVMDHPITSSVFAAAGGIVGVMLSSGSGSSGQDQALSAVYGGDIRPFRARGCGRACGVITGDRAHHSTAYSLIVNAPMGCQLPAELVLMTHGGDARW